MGAPAKKPTTNSYQIMLRYLLFYVLFFGILYIVALFGEVAES
ncbi:hypothetical protein LBMAG01_09720 [Acidobacteriota bacterium]|nr:hypothetical protein LBMAG01_09720 [Acidobacteriota bacterium]